MPVTVTHEALDEIDGPPEICLVCRAIFTRNWWGNGCAPVCKTCAGSPLVTHASMVALCKKEMFGPIPTENTDLEDES